MPDAPSLIAFAGSLRKASLNKQLVEVAARGAESAGARVTIIDLADFPMPLYNQDIEDAEGLPDNARKFKQLLIAHDGMLIASPENNSALSAVLKNAIDWASRKEKADPGPLVAFKGKVAGIMAASPSWMGGVRGLLGLRAILASIGVHVVHAQALVSAAHEAFTDDDLKDEARRKEVENVGAEVTRLIARLRA